MILKHAYPEICSGDLEAKKQVQVRLEAAEHFVLADSATVAAEIFWNLIKNAVKFTPEGGTIEIWTQNKERRVGSGNGNPGNLLQRGIWKQPLFCWRCGTAESTLPLKLSLGRIFRQAFEQADRKHLAAVSEGWGWG